MEKTLVLHHAPYHTIIDRSLRCILLESWRVDIVRRPADPTTEPSPASVRSLDPSNEGELPNSYEQSIALFQSVYTLLRTLPTWKLHQRIRQPPDLALGGGTTLQLRVCTTPSEDPPSVVDATPIIDFDIPLSQHAPANDVDSFSFPPVPSPLGELFLSVKYRSETNFSIESSVSYYPLAVEQRNVNRKDKGCVR